MTDPIRGARTRRSRRPGWILMTVLLVLAIAASSALVFTNRVELLKLAVILALWAAVVAAFVSVIYRRQSDSDQAKVRDLKLVYDLQLDREISARREYELAVESQLRRELAAELRAQSADEVGALRAELAALRANLEYLFDTDLTHRPALEADRARFDDWPPEGAAGRVSSSRLDTEDAAAVEPDPSAPDTEESPIIDVPAEPQPAEPSVFAAGEPGGAHRRAGEGGRPQSRQETAEIQFPWLPPAATPPPGPPQQPPPPPARTSPQQPAEPPPSPWQPVPAEGQFIPAGRPGSSWVSPEPEPAPAPEPAPTPAPEPPASEQSAEQYVGRRRAPEAPAPAAPAARHASGPPEEEPVAAPDEDPDDEDGGAHVGGQSVADLLARFQATPSGGGRRRRRDG